MFNKLFISAFLAFFLFFFNPINVIAAQIKVMTFNNVGKISGLENYAKDNQLDIIGFQEQTRDSDGKSSASDLRSRLQNVGYPMEFKNFTYLGGKTMSIFYKTSFTLLDFQTTYYSGDRGMIMVYLDTPAGKIRIFNNHPQPEGCSTMQNGFNYINSFNDPNYIVMGDYNFDFVRAKPNSAMLPCYNYVRNNLNYSCMNNDTTLCRASNKPGSTIGLCESKENTIYDFIMTSKKSDLYLSSYYTENNICTSDHYPVVATFKIKKEAFDFNNDKSANIFDIFILIKAIIDGNNLSLDLNLDKVVDMKDFFDVAKFIFR